MAGKLGNPGVGRLARVAGLEGEFLAVGPDQQGAGKRADAVFDADLRPLGADRLRNPVLRQVDHEEHDPAVGPVEERVGRQNVVFQRPAVGAPVAPGEDREDRAAGIPGRVHGRLVAGQPAVGCMGQAAGERDGRQKYGDDTPQGRESSGRGSRDLQSRGRETASPNGLGDEAQGHPPAADCVANTDHGLLPVNDLFCHRAEEGVSKRFRS